MPRRFVETEIRYQLKTGCVRFPAPPPRPIVVTPDRFTVCWVRRMKCLWLKAMRRVSARRRKAGKLDH